MVSTHALGVGRGMGKWHAGSIAERDAVAVQKRLEAARSTTFKDCAEKLIAAHKAGWKSAKHGWQWANTRPTPIPSGRRARGRCDHRARVQGGATHLGDQDADGKSVTWPHRERSGMGHGDALPQRRKSGAVAISTNCWPSPARSASPSITPLCATKTFRPSWLGCGPSRASPLAPLSSPF